MFLFYICHCSERGQLSCVCIFLKLSCTDVYFVSFFCTALFFLKPKNSISILCAKKQRVLASNSFRKIAVRVHFFYNNTHFLPLLHTSVQLVHIVSHKKCTQISNFQLETNHKKQIWLKNGSKKKLSRMLITL